MADQDRALLVRCEDLLEADVNGEIVALHIEKGQCYGMNSVASRIWELLKEPISPAQICARLNDEFEVDPETCRTDVAAVLRDFEAEGLVRPARD
jgi:hypothetical protein